MFESDIKVVFFGSSEFAVPILEKLAQSPWRPVLMVSTLDAPAGRGMTAKPPPVKITAEKIGIPLIQPDKLSPIPYPLTPAVDLFIIAAYGKILPLDLLKIPKQGSLNIHPSLLPAWRGASPIQYTILNGDEETGVTIILMDAKVDHGGILRYKKLNIKNQKLTAPELTKILADMGAELLIETIPDWLAGKIRPQPQDETKATYAPRLKKEDGCIDWTKSANDIERMTRAFQPWPGAYAFWQKGGKQVRLALEESGIMNQESGIKKFKIGEVFEAGKKPCVNTGNGALAIGRLKPEGKRSMSAEEFLRGYPQIVGAILE